MLDEKGVFSKCKWIMDVWHHQRFKNHLSCWRPLVKTPSPGLLTSKKLSKRNLITRRWFERGYSETGDHCPPSSVLHWNGGSGWACGCPLPSEKGRFQKASSSSTRDPSHKGDSFFSFQVFKATYTKCHRLERRPHPLFSAIAWELKGTLTGIELLLEFRWKCDWYADM